MDVNGTKFHLLLTRDDWGRSTSDNGELLREIWQRETDGETVAEQKFAWDETLSEITLQPRLFKFTASEKDEKPKLENRRGAARDRYGNWYWIDETGLKIKVLSSGSHNVSDFYPVASTGCETEKTGDFQPFEIVQDKHSALRGLAVTIDHYLVVGTLEPAGLLVFDLFAGGEPRRILWREDAAFAPYDMAARPCGGVFILDRDNKRYWTLDRGFNAVGEAAPETESPDDFQPADESENRQHGERGSADNYFSKLPDGEEPISIEALPDDTVLILNLPKTAEEFSVIYRYYRGFLLDDLKTESILNSVDEDDREILSPPARFRLRGFDIAFVGATGEEKNDRLFIVTEEGNQAFSFRLVCRADLNALTSPPLPTSVINKNFELQTIDDYFPMRLFGGKGFAAAGGKIYYDFVERWLALVKQNRPSFVAEGTLETAIFDGKEPNCVWHRLLLDGCIPPETKIEVFSRTANEEKDVSLNNWQPEPNLYLRGNGSEQPFIKEETVKEKGKGTWELLLQRAQNRYLQLKLVFSGNEQRTPRISALRVYYPRFSYLNHYLPSIYRDDEQSAFFLDRFLANFEGIYTSIEDRIAAVEMLFDVRSAPPDALEWLADWLGAVLDPAWTQSKRRLFISRAVDFFQYRGTMRGLRIALRLALDNCADESIFDTQTAEQKRRDPIRIVERFQTRLTPEIIPPDSIEADSFPRETEKTRRWNPAQGRGVLNQRYSEKFGEEENLTFLLVRPEDAEEAAIWQQFSLEVLGFVPSGAVAAEQRNWQNFLQDKYENDIDALNDAHNTNYSESVGANENDFVQIFLPRGNETDVELKADWQYFVEKVSVSSRNRELWQDFLARRYRSIKQLNDVYSTNWESFALVSLFDRLPLFGNPLADWFQFESGVLPMHETAHRFTVLIPATLNGRRVENAEEQARQLSLVQRVVELEKPAHTTFDFRYYWNLFRLDEVRLGLDTLLGLGSRDPLLNPDFVIGQSFVGEARVGIVQPEKYTERYVLGSQAIIQKKDGEK
jgi:phage tail-like protein